jgi:hypothetical protein
MDRRDLFEFRSDGIYGDDALDDPNWQEWPRFEVTHLGMSAFDPWRVMLVEPADERGLLWRRHDDPETHAAWFQARTPKLGERFVAATDETL